MKRSSVTCEATVNVFRHVDWAQEIDEQKNWDRFYQCDDNHQITNLNKPKNSANPKQGKFLKWAAPTKSAEMQNLKSPVKFST